MHQPTVRVLEVLNYIISHNSGLSLADLSRGLSIPKSTLLPIMQTLCDYGYICKNADGSYGVGVSLYSLGTHLNGKFPVLDFAKQKLKDLVAEFGETCYLGVLRGGNVLYLDKEESTNPLRMLVDSGRTLPAYATGIGKALICQMTKKELTNLYPDGLKSLTPKTVTDFDVLAQQLESFQKKGYSQEIEESTLHIRCFGVPVFKFGKIHAAISIAIPIFRYEKSMEKKITDKLKSVAKDIQNVLETTNTELV